MELPFTLTKFFILSSFILSLLSNIILVQISADNLISNVCRKTRNPNLCSQILNSNRKARKATSPLELGKVAMNLSLYGAREAKNKLLMSQMMPTRNKVLKERYKYCKTTYDCAIHYLETAHDYLNRRDFEQAGRYTAAALNEPIYCRECFAKRAPAEPAWLKEKNDNLECLCSVVLVISNRLSGRNSFVFESDNMYKD